LSYKVHFSFGLAAIGFIKKSNCLIIIMSGKGDQRLQLELDNEIRALSDNFNNLVDISKLSEKDRIQVETERLQTEIYAANIIKAGQALIKLTTELKQSILIRDFQSMNETQEKRQEILEAMIGDINQQMAYLQQQLGHSLHRLENAYYNQTNID